MIGFNFIGRLGRLGNQMFQYAALRGIAHNRDYNFCLPIYQNEIDDGIGNKLKTELFSVFRMGSISALNIQLIDKDRPIVSEKGFEFDENLFNACPDWVSLYGFFQSEKYFKNVEDIIRADFKFKSEILDPCQEMIEGVDSPISLHIRRTDYLSNNQNHNNLGLDYYEKALKEFGDDRQVIVFSDDPEWCKKQELFSSDRFLVSENESGYVDMCLMSLCKDHIIANSTFSWWGAWLCENKEKRVISPRDWFGPNLKNNNLKDLIPETWIQI
jgi:hypothetical protein